MTQVINGRQVFMVELGSLPKLPLTGNPWKKYDQPYLDAVTSAIQSGVISAPGKYAIHLTAKDGLDVYVVYTIVE